MGCYAMNQGNGPYRRSLETQLPGSPLLCYEPFVLWGDMDRWWIYNPPLPTLSPETKPAKPTQPSRFAASSAVWGKS